MEESFFERVWNVAQHIPLGKVTSYGAIAEYLGTKQSARMVGWAMNACDKAPFPIPAHRVVNRTGLLTGKQHFGGKLMEELLMNEGIQIVDNQIQDFENVFWKPSVLDH